MSAKMIVKEIIEILRQRHKAIPDRNIGLRSRQHFRVRICFPTMAAYYDDKAADEHRQLLDLLVRYQNQRQRHRDFRPSPDCNFFLDVTRELWGGGLP